MSRNHSFTTGLLAVVLITCIQHCAVTRANGQQLTLDLDDIESTSAALSKLFNTPTNDELVRHSYCDDASIALQARWLRLIRSNGQSNRVPADDLSRFVGFVEGRLKVEVPASWAEWLRANYESEIGVNHALRDELLGNDMAARLTRHARGVNFTISRSRTLTLPISPKEVGLISNLSVFIDDKSAFLSNYSYRISKFDLFRYSVDPTRELWRSEVWGVQMPAANASLYVKMAGNEKCVFVFGSGNSFSFIEAFDIASGEPQVRFSTEECRYIRKDKGR